MEIHILNGDALIDRMKAAGFENLIVCREALVEGPIDAIDINDFWKIRAAYLVDEEEPRNYFDYVVSEFNKLKEIPADAPINLWFGDDLFCQANLWFLINYLEQLGRASTLFRVFPLIRNEQGRWNEFGGLGPNEFRASYENRVALTRADVALAENLWNAYAAGNLKTLQSLSATPTHAFHDLEKVVQAHIDRPERPQRVLQEIMDSGVTDFNKLFPAFFKREGIYGLGDTQVKNILANMK